MRPLLFLTLLAVLHSCAPSVPAGAAHGRDYWGHRPGPKNFRTVILDAGHGGHDIGAASRLTGDREKDINLDLARRVKSELGSSYRSILLRNDDRFIDLDDRVNQTNRIASRHPDAILVSLHFNAGPTRLRGPETYYWRVDSHGLAVRCQRAMKSVAPVTQSRELVRRRLRLTRNPEIPSVLLEGGYLSHPAEARIIASPAYRQKLAVAIASAIKSQSALGDAGTGPLPRPIEAPPSRASDPPGS